LMNISKVQYEQHRRLAINLCGGNVYEADDLLHDTLLCIFENGNEIRNSEHYINHALKIAHWSNRSHYHNTIRKFNQMSDEPTESQLRDFESVEVWLGDEKQYEYTQNGKYWNIKWAKEQKAWSGNSAPKSYGKSPEDKADIARAVALKAAVDLHKGEGEPMNQQIGVICATAQAFEIYLTTGENPYKDAIQDGKLNNSDDLPF